MSSISLYQRISALQESYKNTLALIADLQKFPNSTDPSQVDETSSLDEIRLDLANTCHDSLKGAEEALALLRQDIDDNSTSITSTSRRRISTTRNVNDQAERDKLTVERLTEDIRHARTAFRRAQLQSKKNLDARKQKDRELLFANRRSGGTSTPNPRRGGEGREKLTQDSLAQNAAEDVTRALKRAHNLLSSNLQQSAFAQQTLEESQEQLNQLGERYTGTTDMLQKSRGLVKTLVTSQKSDTWYLQTSVYILLATIGWLVFRRLLYGPLWWLVWIPVKWAWYGVSLVIGGSAAVVRNAGGVGAVKNGTTTGLNVPRNSLGAQGQGQATGVYQPLPAKGAGWGRRGNQERGEEVPPSPEEVQKVKDMIREAEDGTNVVVENLEDVEDEDKPRNPKKRMMELEREMAQIRDEL